MKRCDIDNVNTDCLNSDYEKLKSQVKKEVADNNLYLKLVCQEVGRNMFKESWYEYTFKGFGGMLSYKCRLYRFIDFDKSSYTIDELIVITKPLLSISPR